MTTLKRPVRRTTGATFMGRPLILILEPPDLVTVREKGRRKGFTLTVEAIYRLAAMAEAQRMRQHRKKGIKR